MHTPPHAVSRRKVFGRRTSYTSSTTCGPCYSAAHLPKSIRTCDDGVMGNPTVKTWTATIAFSIAGTISALFYSTVSPFLLPHFIIYAVLVVNTYFSIRFWSALQPQDSRQLLIDAVLVAAYLTLAFSMGEPTYFPLALAALFVLATFKYVLMRGRTSYGAVVERKIRIDALGALSCAVLISGMLLGYALEATWLFAIGFAIANVYLLFIRPMYRL